MASFDVASIICQALGFGRRRGVQTSDPDRMLLIEMRADFSAKLPLVFPGIYLARHATRFVNPWP
jgi:hypothetical protein